MASENNVFYINYSRLNPTRKALYSELLSGINQASKKIYVKTKCRYEDVSCSLRAIKNDHPEIFWLTWESQVWTRGDYVESVEITYNALAARLSYHKSLFQKAVDSYLKPLEGKSPLEKERLIHDKMVKTITYVYGKYDQTAYSALVEKQSVCAGYSRGFQYLMQRIGLPCYVCSGEGKSKKTGKWESHSWNIIKLGADYYNVDVTWDDCYGNSTGNISYTYFNCTDSEISSNHVRWKEYLFLPSCKGTRYSFENIFGVNPNYQLILQDGLTCRTVINSKSEFIRLFTPSVRKTKKGSIKMSFPTESRNVTEHILDWVKEGVRSVYGQTVGWSANSDSTDYRNGWYRVEFVLTFK